MQIHIQPVHGFIIQQAPSEEKSLVLLPEGATPPNAPLQQWNVLATSKETVCCKPGDSALLAPDTRMIGIDHPAKIVMVHDNAVVGVVVT
jgi:hypothetical protein